MDEGLILKRNYKLISFRILLKITFSTLTLCHFKTPQRMLTTIKQYKSKWRTGMHTMHRC